MIKYETAWGAYKRIRAVEFDRETKSSLWSNGRRCAKRGAYTNYFDTWEEARDFLLDKARVELDQAKARRDRAGKNYHDIAIMEKPK